MTKKELQRPDWFKFAIEPYETWTQGCSMLEEGAYLRLMCRYYSTMRPIPAGDHARIYRLARANHARERAAVDYILTQYFYLKDGEWRHQRIEEELVDYVRRSRNAKGASDTRWGNDSDERKQIDEERKQIAEERSKMAEERKQIAEERRQLEAVLRSSKDHVAILSKDRVEHLTTAHVAILAPHTKINEINDRPHAIALQAQCAPPCDRNPINSNSNSNNNKELLNSVLRPEFDQVSSEDSIDQNPKDFELAVVNTTRKKHARKPSDPSKGGPTFDAYSDAYCKRYGMVPKRNGQVSKLCVQLVDLVGAEDAPALAAFYVGLNFRWYVQSAHSLKVLVSDWAKVRMEWMTGREITAREAREVDSGAGMAAQMQRIRAWEMERSACAK